MQSIRERPYPIPLAPARVALLAHQPLPNPSGLDIHDIPLAGIALGQLPMLHDIIMFTLDLPLRTERLLIYQFSFHFLVFLPVIRFPVVLTLLLHFLYLSIKS